MMENIVVSGSFDNIKSREVRFLEETSTFGLVNVLLWSDEAVKAMTGTEPKFPQGERAYFLDAVRYVYKVWLAEVVTSQNELPQVGGFRPGMWSVTEDNDTPQKREYCASKGITYTVIGQNNFEGYSIQLVDDGASSQNKKVLVTGCYDWLHTGHVRFFEETSQLGDLYVVVGHDGNIRLLKGEGRPMFPEDERRYMVGSIRFVKQALVSSGSGWMDAEPEIEMIQPDIYAVNGDGDKPEKREFCEQLGLEYIVLKRTPAAGLPERTSTNLRGF